MADRKQEIVGLVRDRHCETYDVSPHFRYAIDMVQRCDPGDELRVLLDAFERCTADLRRITDTYVKLVSMTPAPPVVIEFPNVTPPPPPPNRRNPT